MGRLFLLFVAVPLADLALLVWVGNRIGLAPTVGIVLLTAAVGSFLARREGLAAWQRVQSSMRAGGVPGAALVDAVGILIAGVLLLTPGFLTDLAGLAALVPSVRRAASRAVAARMQRGVASGRVRIVTPPRPADPYSAGIEDAEVVDDGRPGPARTR